MPALRDRAEIGHNTNVWAAKGTALSGGDLLKLEGLSGILDPKDPVNKYFRKLTNGAGGRVKYRYWYQSGDGKPGREGLRDACMLVTRRKRWWCEWQLVLHDTSSSYVTSSLALKVHVLSGTAFVLCVG